MYVTLTDDIYIYIYAQLNGESPEDTAQSHLRIQTKPSQEKFHFLESLLPFFVREKVQVDQQTGGGIERASVATAHSPSQSVPLTMRLRASWQTLLEIQIEFIFLWTSLLLTHSQGKKSNNTTSSFHDNLCV